MVQLPSRARGMYFGRKNYCRKNLYNFMYFLAGKVVFERYVEAFEKAQNQNRKFFEPS